MIEFIPLPFESGTEYRISNPKGRYAHKNFPVCKYADDFIVKEGTSVLAVKPGKVFCVKKDSTNYFDPNNPEIGRKNMKIIGELCKKYTNLVCIKHDDGTFTEYLHLQPDIPVKWGDKVQIGQEIGKVGMNGMTNKPHLHFNAVRPSKYDIESLRTAYFDF